MYIPEDHETIQGTITNRNAKEANIYHRFQAWSLQSNQVASLVILTIPLGLVVGGLGKCLLPDGAGSVVIKVCEENVEDLRVPADWVALDALFDVLLSNVSVSPREKRMTVDG